MLVTTTCLTYTIFCLIVLPWAFILAKNGEPVFHLKSKTCLSKGKNCIFKKRYLDKYTKEIFKEKKWEYIESNLVRSKKILDKRRWRGGLFIKKIEEANDIQNESDKNDKCYICTENKISVLCQPCEHTGVCKECALLGIVQAWGEGKDFKCYVCKLKIQKVLLFSLGEEGKLIPESISCKRDDIKLKIYDFWCKRRSVFYFS